MDKADPTPETVQDDAEQQLFSYGHGGVPFLLLLGYLAFLTFFTWYVLEYQLPDFLRQGPGQTQTATEDGAAPAAGDRPAKGDG